MPSIDCWTGVGLVIICLLTMFTRKNAARTSWGRLNCRLARLERRWAVLEMTERMMRREKRMIQTRLEVRLLLLLSMLSPGPGPRPGPVLLS